jgi:hypothetical protein
MLDFEPMFNVRRSFYFSNSYLSPLTSLPSFVSRHWCLVIGGKAAYILPHRQRPRKLFPTATSPKLAPASILVRDQNDCPLNARIPQSREAFLHQTHAQSDSLIPRIHCEVINMSAPPIMAAQRHTHDRQSIGCDPTQSRISGKKPRNTFFVIAFRNLEPLNSFPQLNRGIVIVDRKFSRVNSFLHVGANKLSMHRALLISAFLSCSASSSQLLLRCDYDYEHELLVLCHSFVIGHSPDF